MKNSKNTFLNIVIVILTVSLFSLTVQLVNETRPRIDRISASSAENMIRQVDQGQYRDLAINRYHNELLGVDHTPGDAYTVPYAAADYYIAALNYKGLSKAGAKTEASKYADTMAKARQALDRYEYIADDIDSFFN